MKKVLFFSSVLVGTAAVAATISAAGLPDAVSYLKSQSDAPWVTMALVAAGESVNVDYLKSTSGLPGQGGTAISLEAPILALTAAGEDPRTFPNTNLISQLKGFYDGAQIGDSSAVNDDIFGILALISAGEPNSSAEILGAKAFLLSNQNTDGGWGWGVGASSDTNDTAAAIMALLEVGMSSSDTAIQNAAAYLQGAQNSDGGFPYDPNSSFGTDSDASSSAWVISAIIKLGQSPISWTSNGNNPVDFLWTLQTTGGFFENVPGALETGFTPTETAYAVIALSNKALPVGTISAPVSDPEVHFRIEGSSALVCKGTVQAATAMDAVINAAESCGYTFEIEQFSFGPFLTTINNDAGEGLVGWLYRVDWILPNVGAADFNLSGGETVLWYFADFEDEPLRIESQVVESLSGESWNSVEGATVFFNGTNTTSANDGSFELTTGENGVFEVRAEKEGFVRSDTIAIIVADDTEEIGLSVEVVQQSGGEGGGTTNPEVGFSVSPSNLAFGQLEPGNTVTKGVTLKNEGTTALTIKAHVEGSEVFNFLKIAQVLWSAFETLLSIGAEEQIDLNLTLPIEFGSFGSKAGSLVFWGVAE